MSPKTLRLCTFVLGLDAGAFAMLAFYGPWHRPISAAMSVLFFIVGVLYVVTNWERG